MAYKTESLYMMTIMVSFGGSKCHMAVFFLMGFFGGLSSGEDNDVVLV